MTRPVASPSGPKEDDSRRSGRPSLPLRDRVDRGYDIPIGIWASAVLLPCGLFTPVITVHQTVFGIALSSDTLSVVAALRALWVRGDLLIWATVALFSVAVPLAKICLEAALWYVPPGRLGTPGGIARVTEVLSKLSMTEIMAAAVLIAAAKLGSWTAVELRFGMHLLLGSVLSGLLASFRLTSVYHSTDASPHRAT